MSQGVTMYFVIWRLPPHPTPLQALVAKIGEADVGQLSALAQLAHEAKLEADLAELVDRCAEVLGRSFDRDGTILEWHRLHKAHRSVSTAAEGGAA